MSNVFHLPLLPDTLPNETVKCLAQLTAQARRNKLYGIAFVAYVKGGYIANSAGMAYDNPTLTIGMVHALISKLTLRLDGGNL